MTNVDKNNHDEGFFHKFYKSLIGGSTLLMIATFAAVVWSNVDHHFYEHVWHDILSVEVDTFLLKMTWHHWINDGLMAIFFFVVGLEIKREFLAGELHSMRQASLPIFAAVGGMIVPIILFLSFGLEGDAKAGWGIPMATDIAFSLGILAMLGKRVPLSLKVFLTALAIVDDLGAVLVIALFYGGKLNWVYLMLAGGLLLLLVVANRLKLQSLYIYTIGGIAVWFFFLESGVNGPGTGLHATIAGVLVAFTIPARPRVRADIFGPRLMARAKEFARIPHITHSTVLSDEQMHVVDGIEDVVKTVRSPLQYIEHQLQGFISVVVLPLFALANAGVYIFDDSGQGGILSGISVTIALSLIFGKTIGITFFSWLAVRLGFAVKPKGSSWLSFMGLGLLGGIGFTMSIFIADLAYPAALLNQAKMGIFIGSIISGIAGFFLLKYSLKRDADVAKIR